MNLDIIVFLTALEAMKTAADLILECKSWESKLKSSNTSESHLSRSLYTHILKYIIMKTNKLDMFWSCYVHI